MEQCTIEIAKGVREKQQRYISNLQKKGRVNQKSFLYTVYYYREHAAYNIYIYKVSATSSLALASFIAD